MPYFCFVTHVFLAKSLPRCTESVNHILDIDHCDILWANMIQWSQKSLQFQVFSYHCAAYEYRNDTVVCCMPFYMAAFPCNRAKQSVRTLRVLFALAALSRRPLLWPATVLCILNSGRPAYSPTTAHCNVTDNAFKPSAYR